jgi:RNA polymerase-binding protein DksA
MTNLSTDQFREALVEQRARIEHAREAIHNEHPGSLTDETGELVSGSWDDHMGDTATETHDRELDYGLEENADAVLTEIDAALKRIDAGTYGACEVCGHPIAPERLEARPWATLCIDDQRRREQG